MFTLKSPSFGNYGLIPGEFTESRGKSPALLWEDAPNKTKSFALVVADPDLPEAFNFPRNFFHWVLYDIPATVTSLPGAASPGGALPEGAKELNSDFVTFGIPGFGKGYGPPWPPDAEHRYVFTLYALKTARLDLAGEVDYADFFKVLLPQTILTATLVGLYGPAKEKLPGT